MPATATGRGAQAVLEGTAQQAARGAYSPHLRTNSEKMAALVLSGDAPSGSSADGGVRTGTPAGFKWPFSRYPVGLSGSADQYSVDIDPRSLVNPKIWASTTFIHVDPVSGNDGTATVVSSPSDRTHPAKSIGVAVNLGNIAATPFRVLLKAGTYNRTVSGPAVGGHPISQPCSFEAWGGRAIVALYDVLVWSLDGVVTNCYTASRTNVARVFDISVLDAYGHYTELANVADAATCNTTPNSWAQVGALVYVNRGGGLVVTDANVRCLLGASLTNMQLAAGAWDVYLNNIDFEGGAGGGVMFSTGACTRNIVAEDCTFRYGGGAAVASCGVSITQMAGLTAFFRCDASANSQDGFNVHYPTVTGPDRGYLLTVDCTAKNNGRGTSTSNNGWTLHEDCLGIDVNGLYDGSYGGQVHIIDTSQGWCVGTKAMRSRGDIPDGGTYQSTGYRTDTSAILWLADTLASGNILAINCVGGAIYKRGHRSAGGYEQALGSGVVAAY